MSVPLSPRSAPRPITSSSMPHDHTELIVLGSVYWAGGVIFISRVGTGEGLQNAGLGQGAMEPPLRPPPCG